jgi:predicted O-methyltransferase YrrM
MNPVIESIYRSENVIDADGKPIHAFPTSITAQEGEALYSIVKKSLVTDTLEIGLAYGLSTLFICQALHEKAQVLPNSQPRHTALDPLQSSLWKSIGLLNLERAGLRDLVTFHEKPSHEILPHLAENGHSYGFAFIDGLHLYDYALLDFWYIDRLLDTGGLIMLHDLVWPAVRKVLSFVLHNCAHYEIAPEFHIPTPGWRKYTYLARHFAYNPLEFYSWSLPFKARYLDLFSRNYCVLRKTGNDSRPWTHYRSF